MGAMKDRVDEFNRIARARREKVQTIVSMHNKGYSKATIARRLEIPESTIREILKES